MACALLCAVATAGATSWGASGTTVIGATIPSATTLITTACPPTAAGITDFGNVLPGSTVKTTADCTVTFGSSNDSASLRVGQADGSGTAFGRGTNAWTRTTGSSQRWKDIDEAAGTSWVVRTNGSVTRSLDDGLTWPTSVGVDPLFDDVDVASASVAWLSGGGSTSVRRSSNANGGTPTFPATPTLPGIGVNAIAATSTTTAWVVGDAGAIRFTTDSGATWNSAVSPTAQNLTGIFALDADSLVAWGQNGLVIATSDGTNWRDISIAGGPTIQQLAATSDANLVGVSYGGAIVHTTNALAATPTWNYRTTNSPDDIADVLFVDANNGYAIGENGVLFTTANSGTSWTQSRIGTSVSMASFVRTSTNAWIAAGSSMHIWRAGSIAGPWTSVAPAPVKTWIDVSMTSDGTGWRVGNGGAIEKTTNFGATWVAQSSNTTAELTDVLAFDTLRAIAIGWNGTIVATSDGGTTWAVRSSGTTAELRSVAGASEGYAWAVGSDGTIIGTSDYGTTWTTQRSTLTEQLEGVAAFDRSTAIAVGMGGIAYRTTDGRTWSPLALPSGTQPVVVIDAAEGTSVGYYSSWAGTYRTLDAGATWTLRAPTGTYSSNAISAVSSSLVYGVGNGTSKMSSDGGLTWQSMTGNQVTFHWVLGIAAVDSSHMVAVGDGNLGGTTSTTADVPDYQIGTTDWDDGGGAFAMCLRATSATPAWTVNATCDQSADGAHWRAVPQAASTSEVASTLAGDGNRTADFRFGLRVPAATPPGAMSAGITFLVIAPDV
jgi:photosystem II stability/assembly factor-like uncharacterized protein